MCEANVYLVNEGGDKTLIMEAVDRIVPGEAGIYIENIFGERKTVKGTIKEMALVDHKILIQE
ncbi:MAG: CooT family nickel-binding protein [Eubacteriaceae bacterium]|nr:CooT family nickel-binding protein [Eubacteriaceae bacterium]